MSEPVSNVEIEDVLSSIRRLVSEENRPVGRPDPIQVDQVAPSARSSRLVLTPSLRVAEMPKPIPVSLSEPLVDLEANFEADVEDEDAGFEGENTGYLTKLAESEQAQEDSPNGFSWEPDEDASDEITPSDVDVVETYVSDETTKDDPEKSVALPELDQDFATLRNEDGAPWRDPETTLFEAAEAVGDTDEKADHLSGEAPDVSLSEAESSEGFSWDDVDTADTADAISEDFEANSDTTADAPPCEPVTSDAPPEVAASEDMDHGNASDEVAPVADAPQELVSEEKGESVQQEQSYEETPPEQGSAEVVLTAEKEAEENTQAAQESVPDVVSFDASTDDTATKAATLSAKIAALEATIGQTQDQWEPDGELGDDYAGTSVKTIQWQDHTATPVFDANAPRRSDPTPANPEPTAEPTIEMATPPSGDDSLDVMGGEDAILDEESLRELVADIVREELQGALGERITRNVRKLVRREIHRALTAQELD